MNKVTITAQDEETAKLICSDTYGFTPDAIREVDSGETDEWDNPVPAWMCFESAQDAELWDKQK